MTSLNCECGCKRKWCICLVVAIVASALIGILSAFFEMGLAISVSRNFVWVLMAISVGYLAIMLAASSLIKDVGGCKCLCPIVNTTLIGILGAIFSTVVLLSFQFAAGTAGAVVFIGLLMGFFALYLSGTACLVKCILGCSK